MTPGVVSLVDPEVSSCSAFACLAASVLRLTNVFPSVLVESLDANDAFTFSFDGSIVESPSLLLVKTRWRFLIAKLASAAFAFWLRLAALLVSLDPFTVEASTLDS